MGVDKTQLPFGDEPLLSRVVRIVSSAVAPVVVVAQPTQALPALDPRICVRTDRIARRGPLEGLSVGLAAMQQLGAERAFVCAGDMPLLQSRTIRQLVEFSAEHELTALEVNGFPHPLCAVYCTRLLPQIEALLADPTAGPSRLCMSPRTRRIDPRDFDLPEVALNGLLSINTIEDYKAALTAAGLTPPDPELGSEH
jgi:molybdopterin-guanine dinucleotide biosynthesis protein A